MLIAGCQQGEHAALPPLRVLCGSSMAQPVQEIGKTFGQRHGVIIEYDLGGSETLLPKIITGAAADIYVCHDPFEDKVKQAGRWAGSVVVGHLQPVVAVRPGNPKAIRSLEDLAQSDLKLGISNPEFTTCGQIFVEKLVQLGLRDAVMKQVALQARTHAEVANGLILGPLDAVVVWNFAAALYPGKLEVVPVETDFPAVRVTIVGLTQSPNQKLRDAFLAWCAAPQVLEVFRQHGYVVTARRQP
jgi:molybdate transport system substrate-binding protein